MKLFPSCAKVENSRRPQHIHRQVQNFIKRGDDVLEGGNLQKFLDKTEQQHQAKVQPKALPQAGKQPQNAAPHQRKNGKMADDMRKLGAKNKVGKGLESR